jgi:glycosyltransferase involved in cell wall biosynthesis
MPKKVLIITYYWPPAGGVAVVRWVKFVKYIRDCGWEPVIYTVSNGSYPLMDASLGNDVPENIQVIKRPIWEPHQLYRIFSATKNSSGLGDIKPKHSASLVEKISNWIRGNFFIPDARAFWINPSVKFLTNYLKTNPVDAMVSTGPPHSAHLIALSIKKKTGLPWLADFRDPWTTMDYYKELLLTAWADRKHHRLELEVLQSADCVTVVGNGMKKEFQEKSGRKIEVVTNGFDEDDFSAVGTHLDEHFSMVYTGTFFSRINPIHLWQAMEELKREQHAMMRDLKIKLMGRIDPSVVDSIQQAGLEEFLVITSTQPHEEAVKQMKNAQVLLLCIFEQTKFVLTGKLFEYLASNRPIFCIGPVDGDAAAVLAETGAGVTFSFENKMGIKQHLIDLYQKFKSGELNHVNNNSRNYSHKELVKKIASQLNQITGHKTQF